MSRLIRAIFIHGDVRLYLNLTNNSPSNSDGRLRSDIEVLKASMTGFQEDARIDSSEMLSRIEQAWQASRDYLKDHATGGHWAGELSTSSLSTATAISALSLCRQHDCLSEKYTSMASEAVDIGCRWLASHQNADGGFGDTDRSHSNIATSMLVQAAWELAGFNSEAKKQVDSTVKYVESTGKWDALRRRYGKDKTFVVPILTNCALAGLADWKLVPSLPFEAAWFPTMQRRRRSSARRSSPAAVRPC